MITLALMLIIICTLFILVSNHPIYCLFSLILTFVNFSILLLNLNLEFIALSYLIVYVGAICVLFIFVILLLNIRVYNFANRKNLWWMSYLILSVLILSMLYFFADAVVQSDVVFPNDLITFERDINLYGRYFFNFKWQYLLLTIILLLLAVVATIAVSLKKVKKEHFKFDFLVEDKNV